MPTLRSNDRNGITIGPLPDVHVVRLTGGRRGTIV